MNIIDDLASEIPTLDKYFKRIIPDKKDDPVCGPIWELLYRGGKRFRPVMCVLSCKSVGGKAGTALHAAAIIELFHNFTLIHDDIEDDSLMRRGKPCIHKIYGYPLTINAGDGMLLYTLKALEKTDDKTRKAMYAGFLQVLDGQGRELSWNTNKTQVLDENEYLKMVSMKTGALISSACEIGGVLGKGSRKQVDVLKTFGMAVGTAFQIQDDLLNIIGKEKVYKKEIGGDITEGKRTLMTIHTLNTLNKNKQEELVKILNSNTKNKTEIKRAIYLLNESGSIDYAKTKAKQIVKKAKRKLNVLPMNNSTKKLLTLADFLIERNF